MGELYYGKFMCVFYVIDVFVYCMFLLVVVLFENEDDLCVLLVFVRIY